MTVPPLLATAFDAIPMGIVLIDSGSRVVFYNAYEERRTGRKRADVVGRLFFDEVAPFFEARRLRDLFLDSIGRKPIDHELRLRLPPSHVPQARDVRFILRAVRFGDEHFGLALLQDLDAPRTAERVKDHLLRRLVHDIASPMMVLTGSLELIELTEEADQREALLAEASTAAQQLRVLHDRITGVTRLDSGGRAAASAPVDLDGVIRQALEAATGAAGARDVTLEYESPVDPVAAAADGRLLLLALRNLLDNAIRFSDRGAKIVVALETERGEAVCLVRDSGPGIPAERHSEIFLPFARESDGTASSAQPGMGLAVVDLVARTHGGTVEVACPPEGGSIFTLRLPLA